MHAEDSRRRTLQRSDIAACIAHWEVLDFLVSKLVLLETQCCAASTLLGAGCFVYLIRGEVSRH